MVNWGDRVSRVVIDLLVKGIEVASEQGQNLLTATASLYLAYMLAMWVRRMAHTAVMVMNGAMGGGMEAERRLIAVILMRSVSKARLRLMRKPRLMTALVRQQILKPPQSIRLLYIVS